jgi:hypothetical protein
MVGLFYSMQIILSTLNLVGVSNILPVVSNFNNGGAVTSCFRVVARIDNE